MQELFFLERLDPHQIVATLAASGAISLRLLREGFRRALLHEAEGFAYAPEPEIVGSGERVVRQQMGTCDAFAEGSLYLLLKDAFQTLCDEAFVHVVPYPFASRLRFTDIALQKYDRGSLGITPHRDGLRYCNLICVFMIGGQGRFAVCADRSGRDTRPLDASPGNVILLRAPGFLGSPERPFHSVTDIEETRYTCGLRQQCLRGQR